MLLYLGQRLKEARLSKKLTQAEVTGDFLTRNMLSQIESGKASPSLKTLEYLASRLELSIQELLPMPSDSEKLRTFDSAVEKIRKCLLNDDTTTAIALLECLLDEFKVSNEQEIDLQANSDNAVNTNEELITDETAVEVVL